MDKRVVLITGATGALGQLAAQTFAARGDSLVLLSRNQAELDSLARGLKLPSDRIFARAVDLLDAPTLRATAEAAAAQFGGIHALVHLVGGWTGGKTILESPAEDLTFMLDQHVQTTFHLFQAFTPHLAEHGRVVIVSSPLAAHPIAKMSAYAAAKSAQETLVLTLGEELRERGVTANVIQVKSIDVKGAGKGTSPKEIVAAMEYLFSEDASKVTGARIPLF